MLTRPRRTWYVDKMRGYSRRTGKSEGRAYDLIQDALDAADPGDLIKIAGFGIAYDADGTDGYDEEVTIAADKPGLILQSCIRGLDWMPGGSVFIAPAGGNKTALANHADDVHLHAIGCDGEGTGGGLVNTGARLRGYDCKIEGGALPLQLTLGTVAQIAAKSRGKGADVRFERCEICWADTGVQLKGTDYGAVTQPKFLRSLFHNLALASFEETFLAGGLASLQYRDLLVDECTFMPAEDGTQPTKYFSLNDDNTNTGLVTRCRVPVALNSGKNLVSTGLLWLANYHPAGISTGQPS
jgi:hypothetical protein